MTIRALVPRFGFGAGRPEPALRSFDRLLDELWRGFDAPAAGGARGPAFAPRIDVSETETELRLTAELPGLEEKDFDLTLESDVLTLKGEKRVEHSEERDGVRHVERSSGSFARSLALPFEVDPERVKASYRNGVLMVTIEKPQEAQPAARQIPVTTA